MEAVLLLGGNVGDPRAVLAEAIERLSRTIGSVLALSRDHWTEPWGFEDDRLFLNKAMLISTELPPEALMDACLLIETELGRVREEGGRYASRTIDIDVLLIEGRTLHTGSLIVPHPRMHERAFALGPAADVVPLWQHPVLQRSILDLLNEVLHQRSPG